MALHNLALVGNDDLELALELNLPLDNQVNDARQAASVVRPKAEVQVWVERALKHFGSP
jgi:hypothetical protein